MPPYLAASSDEFALAAVMASPSPETAVTGDIRGAWFCLNHSIRGSVTLGRRLFVACLSAKGLYGSAKRIVALRERFCLQELRCILCVERTVRFPFFQRSSFPGSKARKIRQVDSDNELSGLSGQPLKSRSFLRSANVKFLRTLTGWLLSDPVSEASHYTCFTTKPTAYRQMVD